MAIRSVILAITCVFLASCGRDDPAVTDPPPGPSAAEQQSRNPVDADEGPDAPTYHGRKLGDWRRRAADKDYEVRLEAIEALGELAQQGHAAKALPTIVEALRDRQAGIVRQASRVLEALGSGAVTSLAEALKHDDAELRAQAAVTLEGIGPEAASAVPALIDALADKDVNVRSNASNALVQVGGEALPGLIAALKSEQRDVREQAARTLRKMGPTAQSAVPALVEALQDDDVDVHTAVSSALFAIDRVAAEQAGIK